VRYNYLRLQRGNRPLFRYPRVSKAEAFRLCEPTSSGLGDLLGAWMMPMTLAELKGWRLRIPVPGNAGGIHHDPSRERLTPGWFHEAFDLPAGVELVDAERVPNGSRWFCSLTPQWHLDVCMETSYYVIPWWLRTEVERDEYYDVYGRVARNLLGSRSSTTFDGPPYGALYARRRDRGPTEDDAAIRLLVSALRQRWREWAVVSDDDNAALTLRRLLVEAGCSVQRSTESSQDALTAMKRDFATLAGAQVVVSSVNGGWSAFPYAATRISGAPLVTVDGLERSDVWRVIRAHSPVPIAGVHHGLEALTTLLCREEAT
jgi:hypothetical protein